MRWTPLLGNKVAIVTGAVPAHCTGWRATHALAATLPDAFIQNSVGTRFEL